MLNQNYIIDLWKYYEPKIKIIICISTKGTPHIMFNNWKILVIPNKIIELKNLLPCTFIQSMYYNKYIYYNLVIHNFNLDENIMFYIECKYAYLLYVYNDNNINLYVIFFNIISILVNCFII